MSEQDQTQRAERLGAWWVLPAGLLISWGVLFVGGLRSFGYAVAVTLAVAALVRLILPQARAGGLLVRTRTVDVALLMAFAVATAVLSASLVLP